MAWNTIKNYADRAYMSFYEGEGGIITNRRRAEVQATKERMNRDQIFIMSINPARSDYMFGLEFNFYNCFQKIVTKLEITVTPVNDRGQLQKDQFNRDVRTVRCMGPVRPGSPAQTRGSPGNRWGCSHRRPARPACMWPSNTGQSAFLP